MKSEHRDRYTVIIPTVWNGDDRMFEQAVRSVLADSKGIQAIDIRIIVFLNQASVAEEKVLVKRFNKRYGRASEQLTFLSSERNKGFTGAVNEALFWARVEQPSSWYIVLNDDAFVKPGFFNALIIASRKKHTAIISWAVEHISGSLESCGLTYQRTGVAFPLLSKTSRKDQALACGTCLAFSSTFVEREICALGFLLNPLFFAYAEDVEISLRGRLSRRHIQVIESPLVVHYGSRTAGRASAFQLYHGYRNLVLCILLLWSPLSMLKQLHWVLLGQAYAFIVLLSKGYLLVYPRILWYVIKHRSELRIQRYVYQQHYGHLHSV